QIEKVLQHYNSVMCLSKIAKATDAVLLFDNEVMTDLCLEMFDTQKPSFHDVNRAIVHNLVPALLPKYLAEYQSTASLHPASAHSTATSSAFRTYGRFSSETQRYWGRDHEERWRHVETERVEPTAPSSSPRKSIPLLHDISHLCGHPNYKFLDAKYVPQMSSESPDFGYRDWRQVLRSLQQMNLLGSASELCMSRNTVGTSAVFA
ncbi:TUBD1, partial [Symbiodinium microadriaticum]